MSSKIDNETYRALLVKAVGAMDEETLKAVLKDHVIAKALESDNSPATKVHGNRLTAADIVEDLMTEGQLRKVPSKSEIMVGPNQAAEGGNAPRMVGQHSDFAGQSQGRTADYDKLASVVGELGSTVKSLQEGQEALTKALTALVAAKAEKEDKKEEVKVEVNQDEDEEGKSKKAVNHLAQQTFSSVMSKADDEDEDEGTNQSNDDEDEESGKSLSVTSKSKISAALWEGVQMVFAKSDELKPDQRRRVQKAAAHTLRKALVMARASAEADKSEAAKAARTTAEAIEEFLFVRGIPEAVKAKKAEKKEAGQNQKKWPDEESVKGVNNQLVSLKTSVEGLMNHVANLSRSGATSETPPNTIELVKSDSSFFVKKERAIEGELETGMITDRTYGAAMDLVALWKQADAGMVAEAVVQKAYQAANSEVRHLFPELKGAGA